MKESGSAERVAKEFPITLKFTPDDGTVDPAGGTSRNSNGFASANSSAANGTTVILTVVTNCDEVICWADEGSVNKPVATTATAAIAYLLFLSLISDSKFHTIGSKC
jgi:hypothetical protein